MQGAYIVDELTDLVEEAVLQEFEAISRRGGVLGAMETMYQRGKIQDESMYYEHLKHDGTLPIIGVNTFQNPNAAAFDESAADDFEMELARATPEEKEACLERVVHRQTVEGEATHAAACGMGKSIGQTVILEGVAPRFLNRAPVSIAVAIRLHPCSPAWVGGESSCTREAFPDVA